MTTQPPPPPQHQPPPTKWLVAYRALGLRVPEEYRPWVAQDVRTKAFLTWRMVRSFVGLVLAMVLFTLAQHAANDTWPSRNRVLLLAVGALLYAVFSSGSALAKQTLRWQRVDKHGRPVRPRRITMLGNAEAVVAGAIAVVVLTGGTTLVTKALRDPEPPPPPPPLPCVAPRAATLATLKKSITHPGARFIVAGAVDTPDGQMIAALLRDPNAPEKSPEGQRIELVIVKGTAMYAYAQRGADQNKEASWTSFPEPSEEAVATRQQLTSAVTCVLKVAPK